MIEASHEIVGGGPSPLLNNLPSVVAISLVYAEINHGRQEDEKVDMIILLQSVTT